MLYRGLSQPWLGTQFYVAINEPLTTITVSDLDNCTETESLRLAIKVGCKDECKTLDSEFFSQLKCRPFSPQYAQVEKKSKLWSIFRLSVHLMVWSLVDWSLDSKFGDLDRDREGLKRLHELSSSIQHEISKISVSVFLAFYIGQIYLRFFAHFGCTRLPFCTADIHFCRSNATAEPQAQWWYSTSVSEVDCHVVVK